jgi:outer membrane protein assembly factor BamB
MALSHSGEIVWQRGLGPVRFEHGFGPSPILYGDLVVLPILEAKPEENGPTNTSSRIVACDRLTGDQRWVCQRTSDVASYSVPFIYRGSQGTDELICCSLADGIFSVDPRNGSVNWQIDVFELRTVSSPIAADGLLFGTNGSGAGGNFVVAVQPGSTPQRKYDVRTQAPYVPTLIARNGLLFLWSDKGIASCLRAATGEVVWQERVGGNYSGSPIIAGEHLYCIDDDGVVVVLSASDRFAVLGRNPLGEPSRSTPAVAGNRMYLRSYSQLFALDSDG